MRPSNTRHASFHHLSIPLRRLCSILSSLILILSHDLRAVDRILLKDLDLLFELGLPRTAGAEWVATSNSFGPGLPESKPKGGSVYEGSAWLERTASGEEWMIEDFVKRVPSTPSDLPSGVASKPTDPVARNDVLKGDLAKLKGILREEGKLPERSKDGAPERGWREEHRAAALLFLAQAGQAGAAAEAQDVLDVLISGADSNAKLMEGAFAPIAKERYLKALRRFFREEAPEVVAAEIEAVVNDFGLHWRGRATATRVAARLRTPTPSPYADHPDAVWAATFLQSIPAHEFRKVPQNWLFSMERDDRGDRYGIGMREYDFPDETFPAHSETKGEPRLHLFLQDTDRAILGLANLLDDHRPLRVALWEWRHYIFEGLRRPMEMGDAALHLLRAIIPKELADSLDSFDRRPTAARRQVVLDWFAAYKAAGKVNTAIECIQRADSDSIRECSSALQFVLTNGNAEDLKRVRPVFTDGLVWRSDRFFVMGLLWDYVDRMRAIGAPDESMEADVLAAMARMPSDEEPDPLEGERCVLRVIFHSSGWEEMLAALAEGTDQLKDDPKWEARLEMVGTAIRRETTSARFQDVVMLASKSDYLIRLNLVRQLYLGREKHPCNGGGWSAEAKEALPVLLHDDAQGYTGTRVYAAGTISFVIWRCFWRGEIPEGRMERLESQVPESVMAWRTKSVMAILNGEPHVPFPTAAGAAVVAKQLEALEKNPPDSVYTAFEALPLDVQIGILESLSGRVTWPDSLQRAQLRIGRVAVYRSVEESPDPFKALEGQMLDAALWKKMEDQVRSLAAKGEKLEIKVYCESDLRGLSMSIDPIESARIPLMLPSGWTLPKLGFVRKCSQPSVGDEATHVELHWDTPAEVAAWQKYQADPSQQIFFSKTPPQGGLLDDTRYDSIRDADPTRFEKELNNVLLRESVNHRFFLYLGAVPVTAPDPDKDSEQTE